MSEALKWGGWAPQAASAATAGLNQEQQRGGHALGCEGAVDGSAGPALCMYIRARLKGRRRCFCVFMWERVFASLDCFTFLLFLCIPLSHHSYLVFKGQQTPSWDMCCFSCIKAPPLLPSSLAPASCRLTLWRQVCSTAITLCKNTSNALLPL